MLSKEDLGITLPDRITLTSSGTADLRKADINAHYTSVGYVHKGGRSEERMARKIREFTYDVVVPAFMKKYNVSREQVHVDDYIKQLDSLRVWVNLDRR